MTTYKDAGVDIKSTDALVENISSLSKATNRKGNVDGIGGFGGIFDLKKSGFEDPLLVSGTDGIGTKHRTVVNIRQNPVRAGICQTGP